MLSRWSLSTRSSVLVSSRWTRGSWSPSASISRAMARASVSSVLSCVRPRRRYCAVRWGLTSCTVISPCASKNCANPLPKDPLFSIPQWHPLPCARAHATLCAQPSGVFWGCGASRPVVRARRSRPGHVASCVYLPRCTCRCPLPSRDVSTTHDGGDMSVLSSASEQPPVRSTHPVRNHRGGDSSGPSDQAQTHPESASSTLTLTDRRIPR